VPGHVAAGPGDDPLVIVANRGPVSYALVDGERRAERGHGGLVTALSGLAGHFDGAVWVCAALSEEDVAVTREHDGAAFDLEGDGPSLRVRMLELDSDAQHKFYAVISNPLLWFIQHYLWDLSDSPDITRHETDAFDNGYAPVNDQFADAVVEEIEALGGRATVMLQDPTFTWWPSGCGPAARAPSCTTSSTSPGPTRTHGRCCRRPCARPCSTACSAMTWSPSTPGPTPGTSSCAARSCSA